MADMRLDSGGQGLSKGSAFANIIEVDPADGSTSGTLETLPWIKDSTYTDEHSQDETPDEGGNVFKVDGSVSRTLEIIFMQLDKVTKELGYNLQGRTYRIVKEEHIEAVNGFYQYRVFPLVQISKSTTKAAQGGEIPYTFNVLNNSMEIGVDLSEHVDAKFQSTLTGLATIAKDQGSVIVEIAV